MDYTDKSFKVEYHNVQNLITKSDNGSDNNLQNLITKSVLEQKLKEYSQNLITKSAKINHNINNTIINNTYKNNISPNIGTNNIIYISEQEEKEKSNSKVNCYISEKEIEEYNNSVNSSEAFNESETGKENLKKKEIESNNSVNFNYNNLKKEEIEESKESVNSNEENTAVLSHSNQLNEESVISTKKTSENGLKQAKTRELEIINKTDNSNYNNLKKKEIEESKESVNSKNVIPNNNLDNSNYNNLKKKEIEESKESVNSNEGINSTIAEGDNSTANAVQEFRNKCIKYTIILEGKKIEIDRSVDVFVKEYYSQIMNNILKTKEFEEQRKIFNRMIVDNQLTGSKYDEMCDKLDIRFAQYNQVDKEVEKSKKEKEFTQEEAIMIANSLLDRCLNCGLDADNNLTNFYNYRDQYNWFIEEYGINKEGSKLQKKYSELISEKKKRNESVKAKAFAN